MYSHHRPASHGSIVNWRSWVFTKCQGEFKVNKKIMFPVGNDRSWLTVEQKFFWTPVLTKLAIYIFKTENYHYVFSVGCGCGTFEWLLKVSWLLNIYISRYLQLQEATGLKVRGFEVNRSWWEGTHSTPHFIDLGKKNTQSNWSWTFYKFNHHPIIEIDT